MCAVSVIYDIFSKLPDTWYNQEHIDLFRNMITDARTFDVQAGQPDCEDPEKAKLEQHIEELERQIQDGDSTD